VLDVFPESTHAPILYPIAVTASSTSKEAPSFLTYLKTASAQSVFEAQGFKVLLNY
jgi:molybdate transport system substrate-binding protein